MYHYLVYLSICNTDFSQHRKDVLDNVIVSPSAVGVKQHLKTDILGREKTTLNMEEVLSALSISASVNPMAAMAVEKLPELAGCTAHCTAILSDSDSRILHDLKIDATCEPEFSSNNLYQG